MPNKSHYNGNAKSTAAIRGPDTTEYHVDLIVRHARRLLELGGTIEQVLDLVMLATVREFQCRIVILRPSRFLVDGGEFAWPLAEGTWNAE